MLRAIAPTRGHGEHVHARIVTRFSPATKERLVLVIFVILGLTFAACSNNKGQSTRLTGEDILVATDQVREKLASSSFLAERTPADGALRLAPGRVRNLSNDRLSKGDQLVAVRRVLADQGLQDMLRAKQILVIMPPKEAEAYADDLLAQPEEFRAVAPTHAFRAEFRSLTRAGGDRAGDISSVRQDFFLVDYSILDLASSRVVWTDTFEVSRRATGLLLD
jgi:hypothetical protein